MDIDKVYRLAGGALKRIWKLYISKPFRDYNVENRAQKAISKEKPEPAQWHDSTQEAFKEAKKCKIMGFILNFKGSKTLLFCFCSHRQLLSAVQQIR